MTQGETTDPIQAAWAAISTCNSRRLLQSPFTAQMLQQEALAKESGWVVRHPPQLGLHGLELLALLRGQVVSANARGTRLALAVRFATACLGFAGGL